MTITNYTDLELKLQAEVAALKAENENLRAYAKHERSLGAEPFAIENLDLTQQVEILKAEHIAYISRTGARILALHDELGGLKAKSAMDDAIIAGDNALIAGLKSDIAELKAKLAKQEPDSTCPMCRHEQNEVHVHCNNCGETYTIEYTKGTP